MKEGKTNGNQRLCMAKLNPKIWIPNVDEHYDLQQFPNNN